MCAASPLQSRYLRAAGITILILAGPWNGVDTTVFHPRDPARARDGTLRVVSVGRLVHEKRAELLVPLVEAMRRIGLRFHLTVVGDGALAALVSELRGSAQSVTSPSSRSDRTLTSLRCTRAARALPANVELCRSANSSEKHRA